jgi:hypothetical protein
VPISTAPGHDSSRGTDGSNPVPSSRESTNLRSLSGVRGELRRPEPDFIPGCRSGVQVYRTLSSAYAATHSNIPPEWLRTQRVSISSACRCRCRHPSSRASWAWLSARSCLPDGPRSSSSRCVCGADLLILLPSALAARARTEHPWFRRHRTHSANAAGDGQSCERCQAAGWLDRMRDYGRRLI